MRVVDSLLARHPSLPMINDLVRPPRTVRRVQRYLLELRSAELRSLPGVGIKAVGRRLMAGQIATARRFSTRIPRAESMPDLMHLLSLIPPMCCRDVMFK